MEYEAELPLFHHAHLTRISTQRPDPWRRLAALSSPILFTDPGGLHWLLGQAPLRPSVVLTSASHLSDHLRSEAENHLQCQVIDYYATTEVGAIAADCIHHQKHVLSPEVFVESVEGELVVTRLRPGAIPILRYRTGDSGQVVWKDCTCGTSGWVIPSFSGRHACWFINPRGEQVDAWQFAWLFKHHAVHTFRMTQESSSDFTIELLGSGTTELHSHLVEALARKGWLDAAIRYVEGVANTPGNKPQPFVSRLSP